MKHQPLTGTHLLIEEFAGLLLYRVDELHLARWEAHEQGDALCCSCEGVEVMTRGLRSFVYPLVYGLTKISSLEKWETHKYLFIKRFLLPGILTMLRRKQKSSGCDRHCLKTLSLLQGDLRHLTLQLGNYVYLKAFLQRLTEHEDLHIIHLYLSLGKEHQAY